MNEKQAFVKFTQADKCSASEFALAKIIILFMMPNIFMKDLVLVENILIKF